MVKRINKGVVGMNELFTEHAASVGENYLEHLFSTTRFSGGLLIVALVCLVHEVLSWFGW